MSLVGGRKILRGHNIYNSRNYMSLVGRLDVGSLKRIIYNSRNYMSLVGRPEQAEVSLIYNRRNYMSLVGVASVVTFIYRSTIVEII